MARYRFLFSLTWIGAFVLCVIAGLVCIRLGEWQLHRWQEKKAINASIDNARTAAPIPAAKALSTHEQPTHRREYTKVVATGQYDASKQVIVRNQSVDSTIGFDVLTPLNTTDGRTLWVVRGWIQASANSATDVPKMPAPPSGTVSVVGRIKRVDTGATEAIKINGEPAISRITMHQVRSTGRPSYEAYIQMISEKPAAADTTTLTQIPAPDDLDEGLHIAYWVQWNLFAGGFIIGFFWYARNYARQEDETVSDGSTSARPASPAGPASPASPAPTDPSPAAPSPAGAEPVPAGAVAVQAPAEVARPVRQKRQKRRREPLPAPIPTRNGKPIAMRVPVATRNGIPIAFEPDDEKSGPA